MKLIDKYQISEEDIDRIISMAWEDRTPFEAIEYQFGLPESEVIKLMKSQMHLKTGKNGAPGCRGARPSIVN